MTIHIIIGVDMTTITDHWNIVVVVALNLTQEMMKSVVEKRIPLQKK